MDGNKGDDDRDPLLEKLLKGGLLNVQDQIREALMAFTERNAVFKTKVQSGGRISIPEAERDVLEISEGDIVQVILAPIKRRG